MTQALPRLSFNCRWTSQSPQNYRALTGAATLRRLGSARGNLCGAPMYARGTMLTISFAELAQAQGLSGRLLDGNIRRLKRVAPNSARIFWIVRPSLPGHDASVSARRCDLQ